MIPSAWPRAGYATFTLQLYDTLRRSYTGQDRNQPHVSRRRMGDQGLRCPPVIEGVQAGSLASSLYSRHGWTWPWPAPASFTSIARPVTNASWSRGWCGVTPPVDAAVQRLPQVPTLSGPVDGSIACTAPTPAPWPTSAAASCPWTSRISPDDASPSSPSQARR
jgi:hypothetical protein